MNYNSYILLDQSTSRHSYVPQTNRDSSNVIGREVFRPQPKSWGPIELGCPSVCHRFLVRTRTFERKVIETWLQAQMKGLGPQICLLTISVKNTPPEVVKLAKIAQNSGFSGLELVRARTFELIPLRIGGRLGPFRVSQILPCLGYFSDDIKSLTERRSEYYRQA